MRHLLLPFLLLPATLAAQTLTDQFIELTVSDTMALPISGYVFEVDHIAAEPEPAYAENTDWEKAQRKQEEQHRKQLDQLQKELQAKGWSVTLFQGVDEPLLLTVEPGPRPATLHVTVPTTAELQRLVNELRGRQDVTGHLVRIEHDRTRDAQTELLTRMYAKAEQRARAVAALSGRKLGKLLQVRSPGEEAFSFADFLQLMESERNERKWAERYGINMPQEMIFRFALTD